MKQLLAFFLICGIFLMSVGCDTKDSSSGQETVFSDSTVKALDAYTESLYRTYPIPGIAIALIRDNAVYIKTAGHSQVSSSTPFTDSTTCFMGNLSELMVATATLKLAQSGKIGLDDPVVKHLPYFKLGGNTYQHITIRNLLTHTSGVPHHDAMWDLPNTDENALEITTRSVVEQEPLFNPGQKVKRSPYNYDILADLIQHVTGMPFEQYAKQEVLKPLNMDASTFLKADITENNLAQPHKIDNWLSYSIAQEKIYPYNREHAGSIGLHASITDISSWMHKLLRGDNDFLNEESHEELLKTQYQTSRDFFVGLGWEIEQSGKDLIYKKTHQTGGFSADITMIPAKKTGVVVISNIGGDFAPQAISHKLLSWLEDGKSLDIKIPVHIAMSKKLNETGSLDSAFNLYTMVKQTNSEEYDLGVESLSQLGVNLLYRLNDAEKAKKVFEFCTEQFQGSAYAHLNLAEAHLVSNNLEKASEALAVVKKLPADHPEMASRLAYVEEMLITKKESNDSLVN